METREILYIIIKVSKYLVIAAICILGFITAYNGLHELVNKGKTARQSLEKELKRRGIAHKYKMRMSQLGIMYRMKDNNLSPVWYVTVRTAFGVLLTIMAFIAEAPFPFPLLGIPIGYVLLDLIFKHINENDNKAFLVDIFNTYSNLNIQLKNGLYISNALEYSYRGARNERYKQALEEMILNLSDKTVSMAETIDIFHSRFLSPEIDNLCSMLNNLLQYGIDDAYAKNMLSEIQTIMLGSAQEAEHDIETKTGMITMAFFIVIVFLIVITIWSGISNINFFN